MKLNSIVNKASVAAMVLGFSLAAQSAFAASANIRMLNPQPLPPRKGDFYIMNRGGNVSLNPQPLPPKQFNGYVNPYGAQMLNPQPLPPKQVQPLR